MLTWLRARVQRRRDARADEAAIRSLPRYQQGFVRDMCRAFGVPPRLIITEHFREAHLDH